MAKRGQYHWYIQLKGILYDINPTYVLTEPGFKNSVQIFYSSKLLPGSKGSPELAKQISGDVITFKNSLLRAQLVSRTTEQHKNILFAIADARDIIAHCELNLLNIAQMNDILQRDYYTMLKSYIDELGLKSTLYFEQYFDRLSKISISKQTDLAVKVKMLLELHIGKWEEVKDDAEYVQKQKKVTRSLLKAFNRGKTECPACKQDALVNLQEVMNYNSATFMLDTIGYEVKKLTCHFCKLKIDDPATLDLLGIKFVPSKVHCGFCQSPMDRNDVNCPYCHNVAIHRKVISL